MNKRNNKKRLKVQYKVKIIFTIQIFFFQTKYLKKVKKSQEEKAKTKIEIKGGR